MDYILPHGIVGEKDLDIYESFLSHETEKGTDMKSYKSGTSKSARRQSSPDGTAQLSDCLKKSVGKLIRAELLLGERYDARTGVLLEIGDDFIVIKQQPCCTAVIPLSSVKMITVAHDNNRSRLK